MLRPPSPLYGKKLSVPRAGIGSYAEVYRPETAGHWRRLGIPAPDHQYLCQETSGVLVDSFGGVNLTKTSVGQLYGETVDGWITTWVGTVENTAHGWAAEENGLWTLNTQSVFTYGVLRYPGPAPGSVYQTYVLRSGNELGLRTYFSNGSEPNPDGMLQLVRGVNDWTTNPVNNYSAAGAFPVTLMYDRRASGRYRMNTHLEQVNGTYAAFGSATHLPASVTRPAPSRTPPASSTTSGRAGRAPTPRR